MRASVFAVILLVLSLFGVSVGYAQSCGTISECKGIAAGANEQAKQYAQETADAKRIEREATADAKTATAQALPTATPIPPTATELPQLTVTPSPVQVAQVVQVTKIVITVIPAPALMPTPSPAAAYIERITPGLIAAGIMLAVILGLSGVYVVLRRMGM